MSDQCQAFSHGPTLCDPMDCGWPGSTVLVILQARTLEWVAIPFSRRSSPPRDQTRDSCITDRLFTCLSHQFLTVVFPNKCKVRQRKNSRSSPHNHPRKEPRWTDRNHPCSGRASFGPAPLTWAVKIAQCSEGHSGPRL